MSGNFFGGRLFDGGFFGAIVINVGAGVDGQSWQEAVQARFDELNGKLEVFVKQEAKIEKRIATTKKKAEKAKHPEGILANLHMLELKKQELQRELKDLRLQIEWSSLEFDDEEDEEILLLQ